MARTEYIYVTATDSGLRKDQAVFRLQVGGSDNASDVGDPHLRTVDGKRYDFQAAGEFTLLRDRESGMEIQVRQTPVETPPPITDSYSGLTTCVSLNTAVAARVASHRISYQPVERGRYRLFVDGKPRLLTNDGIDLDGHRVSAFDAGSEQGLRVDFSHGTVLLVTPLFWTRYGIAYVDVSVSKTAADEGLVGRIPKGTWLPMLPSGATVGPRPESLIERYVALYRTFADAWRVTDRTSMFWYASGTSTATFTDRDWPPPPPAHQLHHAEFPLQPAACKLKPGFQEPTEPILKNIDLEEAKRICKGITVDDLNAACVFDVVATGDEEFAKGYLIAQDLRCNGSAVQIAVDKPQTGAGQPVRMTAVVAPLSRERPTPTGSVTFLVDDFAVGRPVPLDSRGRASLTSKLAIGEHLIRATYLSDGRYHPSSSPSVVHVVLKREESLPTDSDCARPLPRCAKWIHRAIRNACKLLSHCIERIIPCECGGDHSRAEHPGSGHAPDGRGGAGHGH
jgi:hypothetical protein